MDFNHKIAIINPQSADGLARTIFDGLLGLQKEDENLEFFLSSEFNYILPLKKYILSREEFIKFARQSDFIFLIWSKDHTDFKLAEEINQWQKAIFIDGSELGKNNRFDVSIQKDVLELKYKKQGAINKEMLEKCALYFRREKPYINGIIPLPFGIESIYLSRYKKDIKKDIDFHCVFGQDKYPPLRKYVAEILVDFCQKNNFTYHIEKTKTREEFYDLLNRSKVGISIGGGGFDSMRFWEILGNNCLLLTEKIDIYQPDSDRLNYKCIYEFSNLYDFQSQLEKVSEFLRNEYNQEKLDEEYQKILTEHSSKARVREVLGRVEKIRK
jgi:hypothetical protein